MSKPKNKEVAIRVKNIHKDFLLPQNKNTSLKQAAVNIVKRKNKVTQKVLDGVSFDIHKGDFFGIVGRNGSGKSTLLKLIAGVYYPTSGLIEVNGGLTPFIELGVGFNPELSGRDNVYLNGALLGFTRKEMDEMYDEIVEFAELGPFMGQKLKNYSSGMQVRLAFSIAIKAKNDILIFDEVLAVGDEAFQRKCLDVFEDYKKNGQTVILVTHDMGVVKRFCTKALLLGDGIVLTEGDQKQVADYYSKLNQDAIDRQDFNASKNSKDKSSVVSDVALIAKSGKLSNVKSGDTIELRVKLKKEARLNKAVVNLYKNSGEYVYGVAVPKAVLKKGSFSFITSPRLGPGRYHFALEFYDEKNNLIEDIFRLQNVTVVESNPSLDSERWSGLLAIDHEWK